MKHNKKTLYPISLSLSPPFLPASFLGTVVGRRRCGRTPQQQLPADEPTTEVASCVATWTDLSHHRRTEAVVADNSTSLPASRSTRSPPWGGHRMSFSFGMVTERYRLQNTTTTCCQPFDLRLFVMFYNHHTPESGAPSGGTVHV